MSFSQTPGFMEPAYKVRLHTKQDEPNKNLPKLNK